MTHRLDITKTNTQHVDSCLPETQDFRLNAYLLGVAKKRYTQYNTTGGVFRGYRRWGHSIRSFPFPHTFRTLKKIKKNKKSRTIFRSSSFLQKSIILFLHMEHIRPLWFP